MINSTSSKSQGFEINENYVEEVGKFSSIIDHTPGGKEQIQITSNLFEQLKASKHGTKRLIYNFMIFITYNISVTHYCLYQVTQALYLIPTIILFLIIMIISFLFQRKIDSILTKSKSHSFCQYLEENFGSISALICEIITVIWVGTFFMIAFIVTKSLIHNYFPECPIWADIIFSILYFGVILLINWVDSTILMEINIVITIIIIVGSFISFLYNMFTSKCDFSTAKLWWNNEATPNYFYESINILSGSFNMFIILYFINNRLKHSNFSLGKHNSLYTIGYIIEFIFYFLFIFHGYSFPDSNYSKKFYLTIIIESAVPLKVPELLVIILFIVDQVLHTNFYFFVMKHAFFRPDISRFLTKWKFVALFSFVLFLSILLGFFCDEPYYVVMVSNATFGFLINFAFPCKT